MLERVRELIEEKIGDGYVVVVKSNEADYETITDVLYELDDYYSYADIEKGVKIYRLIEDIKLSEEDCNMDLDGHGSSVGYLSTIKGEEVIGVVIERAGLGDYYVYAMKMGVGKDKTHSYKNEQVTFEMFIDENERLPKNLGEFVCYYTSQYSVFSSDHYKLGFETYEEAKAYAEAVIKEFKES